MALSLVIDGWAEKRENKKEGVKERELQHTCLHPDTHKGNGFLNTLKVIFIQEDTRRHPEP